MKQVAKRPRKNQNNKQFWQIYISAIVNFQERHFLNVFSIVTVKGEQSKPCKSSLYIF